jgi:hypothetical protein
VNSDTALWFLGNLIELVVIGFLIYRRVWRTFSAFFIYSIWSLLASVGTVAVLHWYSDSSPAYVSTYLVSTFVDSLLMFCVLVELAWSVLRPIRASLSRSALVLVAGIILLVGAAIWPFAAFSAQLPGEYAILARLQQTSSILQILVFLVLVSTCQLFSVGWRNREMQIATGLGFFSFVNLAAAMLRAHMSTWAQYGHLNQFVIASYIASLLYWAVSFAQKEPERRKFTPEMQRLLLAVAGAAHSTRIAMEDTPPGKAR